MNLQNYKIKYDQLSIKKNLSSDKAMEAVKQDGNALRYVKDQTEAICLEAVKQNGYALRYVKDQTEAICLEAVKQNGYALRYINSNMFLSDNNDEIIEVNGKKYKLIK